jgi:hypothetical protein
VAEPEQPGLEDLGRLRIEREPSQPGRIAAIDEPFDVEETQQVEGVRREAGLGRGELADELADERQLEVAGQGRSLWKSAEGDPAAGPIRGEGALPIGAVHRIGHG